MKSRLFRYRLSNIRKRLNCGRRGNPDECAPPAVESLTPVEISKLYSQIFTSVAGFTFKTAFFTACGVVVSIFTYRLLGPAELGKLSLILTVSSTIGALLGLGFSETLAKFIPQKIAANDKSQFYTKSLAIVSLSFVVFALLYFAITTIFPILPHEIKEVRFAFLLLIGTYAVLGINNGMLRGIGKFNLLPNLGALKNLVPSIVALPILFYLIASYKVVFYNAFFFQFFTVAITFYLLKSHLKIKEVRDLKIERQVITFSLIMLGGSIVYMLCTTTNMVLLRVMMDSGKVGYYTAGTGIPIMLQGMFLSPLTVPFLYYFSHPESRAETQNIIRYGTRVIGFTAGIISLLIFALADKIILIFLGAQYSNSILVLQIFSTHTFLLGILTFSAVYFLSINKPHIGVLLGLLSFVLNFIFDLILIPYMGAAGAALAAIIGLAISLVVYIAIMRRFGVNLIFVFALATILGISFFVGFKMYVFLSIPLYLLLGIFTKMIRKGDIENMYRMLMQRREQ